jgi:hypothetical protein
MIEKDPVQRLTINATCEIIDKLKTEGIHFYAF